MSDEQEVVAAMSTDVTSPTPVVVSPEPSKVKRKSSALSWIMAIVFLLSTVAGFGLYTMQRNQLKDAKRQEAIAKSNQVATQTKLTATAASLKTTQDALAVAYKIPSGASMSPQCSQANNDRTYLAPVTHDPVGGYSVYFVNCLSDLIAGKTTTGKVIAFKVGSDGTQSFAFGAGSGEPYCISAKITTADAAAAISKATTLPVCKTF